jgi:hypothetical protein
MIKENDILYNSSYKPEHGVPLGWIIDNTCVHSLPIQRKYVNIFLNHDSVIEIINNDSLDNSIHLKFLKNNKILEEIEVSEKFGSILLSNPTVINLSFHKFGYLVDLDLEYNFVNYEIVPIDNNIKYPSGWYLDKSPVDDLIKCYKNCNCEICIISCACGWSN